MTGVLGRRGFDELLADRRGLLEFPHYRAQVEAIAGAIVTALRSGNKVLWCGNGGSAAEAQHMAAELSGRFLRERGGDKGCSDATPLAPCIGQQVAHGVHPAALPGGM